MRALLLTALALCLVDSFCAGEESAASADGAVLTKDWGKPEYVRCVQPYTWSELIFGYKNSSTSFKMGGLGKLLEEDGYETWLCFKDHFCAVDPTNPWFCFVYHETNQVFTPWGENNQLKLLPVPAEEKLCTCDKVSTCVQCEEGKWSSAFFDASVVRYPSSYSYAATYQTRSLTPAYANGTFTAIDVTSSGMGTMVSIDWKYWGGVLGPDGLVYFVPHVTDNIGVLDPSTQSLTLIDITRIESTNRKYSGGVLGPDGLIYFVPYYADNIGVLDPSTQSFTVIDIASTISTNAKYMGGVLGPDGNIYFVPHYVSHIGVLDPSTQSFTVIDIASTISGSSKYMGGVLGPNGVIYFVPYSADNIGVLDLSTQSFTVIDIASTIFGNVVSGYAKYTGGILVPNGVIYFVPCMADKIGMLEPGNTPPVYTVAGSVPEAWSSVLSPHFNKF